MWELDIWEDGTWDADAWEGMFTTGPSVPAEADNRRWQAPGLLALMWAGYRSAIPGR